jgi:hypothetical protein
MRNVRLVVEKIRNILEKILMENIIHLSLLRNFMNKLFCKKCNKEVDLEIGYDDGLCSTIFYFSCDCKKDAIGTTCRGSIEDAKEHMLDDDWEIV